MAVLSMTVEKSDYDKVSHYPLLWFLFVFFRLAVLFCFCFLCCFVLFVCIKCLKTEAPEVVRERRPGRWRWANVRPIAAYTGGLKGQVCSLAYELAVTWR